MVAHIFLHAHRSLCLRDTCRTYYRIVVTCGKCPVLRNAGCAASRPGRVSLYRLAAVVLVYQTLGTLGEWAISGSLAVACQDIRIGIPGILMQIFGGMAVLRCILHR